MDKIKALLKRFLYWLKYKLFPRYALKVSYNNTWGDQDDQEFIVKRFHKRKEKYLKFVTDKGDVVEIRGADGLNYRIEQL
tara:strand:+ start:2473 stop:2712 length:240 start_codon:yes stop_codon:yes gene_type:complete